MIKNYKNESMVDVAYEILVESGEASKFSDLYKEVCSRKEFTETEKFELISKFYTGLMMDGRFTTVGSNEWDLKTRHVYKKDLVEATAAAYSQMDAEAKGNRDMEEYDQVEKEELAEEEPDGNLDEDSENYDESSSEEF